MKYILYNLRKKYKNGDNIVKLAYINIAIFTIYIIIHVPQSVASAGDMVQIERFFNNYLSFSTNTKKLIYTPWTLLSYMFIHKGLIHILFNMIWFYFGSRLFLQYLSNRQLLTTYILGGISGAIFFKLIFNAFPEYFNQNYPLIGASAAVVAIIIAIATYRPNHIVPILLIRRLKLKHIAWLSILLFYTNIEKNNPGGHIAHLGGAIYGYIYVILLKRGFDISINFYKIINMFSIKEKRRKNVQNSYKRSEKNICGWISK